MKLASLLLLAFLLPSAGLARPAATPPAIRPPAPAATPTQDVHQQAYDDFVKRFKQFLGVNDSQGMTDLVRKNPTVAVRFADTLCQQIAVASSDELEKQVAALRKAWKAAMDTNFVENLYEYHSLLKPIMRTERTRLTEAYDKALGRYTANMAGDQNGAAFEASAGEFASLADGLAQVGDLLNVGRCWQVVGACWDEGLRGKEANLYRACEAMGKALDAYKKIGLVGPDVTSLRTRYDFLAANGYDQPEPEGAGKADAPAAAPGAPAINAPMTFEAVDDPQDYERPNYFADEAYQIWSTLPLAGRGTTVKFPAIQESGMAVERTGAAQFTVRDASAKPREGITVTGNTELVHATLKDDNGEREWAFLARIGLTEDTYQGRKAHLGPSDEYLPLFYWAAASMVGEIDGTTVRVLDDNMDGIYGSAPLFWKYLGLGPDASQPDFDSIVLGKSKRAIPWSRYVKIDERWYQLEAVQGGTILKATPVDVETGTLTLDFKGEWPEWLVVSGEGSLGGTYIDLCENGKKKPVEVPVGEYRLYAGEIRKGKKVQMMKCLILGNDQVATWKVTAGKDTPVKLGGPLHFVFQIERNGDKGVVKGSSVEIVGAAGETYDRFWNCAPEPSVSSRKEGTKRGGRPEEMPKVVGDMDELKEDGSRKWSFADVWRPMDLPVELVRGGAKLQLQMTEKKNKLLGGPIESEWQ